MPVTSSAKATFSQTVLVGRSLKSWKMIPILRRIRGTWRARQVGQVLAVEDDLAAGRQLVADEQLDQGRLAGAGRPHQEDEVALGDDEVDLAQGQLPVRVLLRDVVEDEDRPLRLGLVVASPEDAAADGARLARRWGDGHVWLRGREWPDRPAVWQDRLDSVRGHGRGSHVDGEATTGPTANLRRRRKRAAGATGSSEQARRDRQVAREVGERPVPADQDRERFQAEAGLRAPAPAPDRPPRRSRSRTRRAARPPT